MKKLLVITFVLVVASAFLFGATYRIGLSLSTLNNPFFVTLRDGALEAAAGLGIEVIVADGRDNPAKQLSDIEDFVQQKLNLIIINPTDSDAIVTAVEEANKAGIPVITVDRGANGGKVVAHIASDNVAGGMMAGEYVAMLLNGKGNVVELEGIVGTSAARDRGQGFGAAISKYPGIKIVAKQVANFNRAEGLVVIENILQANPNIDAVFAHNDEMALGAIEAIKAAGLLDKIKVVGFDAIDDAVAAVNAGEMAATVAQQPFVMGQLAVVKAFEYLTIGTIYIPVDLQLVTLK
ncbi:D-ribose transporter subunit RbsB [Mesotoga sp. Brook.08.YT.4.2.5.1]|jgi:ribose transport system substrate-binding protein|uniref:D-ribose ABC transporter substrate-binding protein n=1 Tax=unclassified Mesotoga TaxID=1184398 RepID=UPI000AFF2DAC|nr:MULTISPECIES: D-ribose ABC transporter substrate-binding protein [unclassified Mesotoga]MDD3459954.1 D-ribose ABC transporter substrate-binding protein [Mesotoga sp.]PNE16865.1 D-ribose transporter subunit RbsB [Mesotoga sp. Brook.08.YT.4.2.5.1]PVD17862.1 D-ribose transporter subunit RbsB [Mesotoga sp. Brook.08.105.5.1]RAO96167.1 D-ribose transporter subunit RbsB [Mesotoga sp. Brook.08.YT.4.2.5.4.]RDI91899.1 D-ribose transporter subunit RbsB [Mesotoga sp. Brook.08.YT.4.2.5.2.]